MRNRALHDALRDFALEAAAELTRDLRDGAEIAFEVVEEPRGPRRAVLYRYRPLTADFIAERWDALRALPGFAPAARTLGRGAELYLRVRGDAARADAEPALMAMLERLYEDSSNFEFPEERFDGFYAELERALHQDTLRTAIVAPIDGLWLERGFADLGDGLFLIHADKLDAPPAAVWDDGEPSADPQVLCLLRRDIAADAPLPVAEASARFAELVSAMRLFKSGRISLAPIAWARIDEGAWQPVALRADGAGRGPTWKLTAGEEGELVELQELLRTGSHGRRIAWARGRFEMGLARESDLEALPDYRLALETLFEATDEPGRASLPLRVAALCAEPPDRALLNRRVQRAFALERRLIAGVALDLPDDDDEPRALVYELEHAIRALLRDLACGYLDSNLRAAADEILLASGEALDIRAGDLRAPERAPSRRLRSPSVAGSPGPDPWVRHDPAETGVTESSEWASDWAEGDGRDYSAPV
ncbi:MAG: hypothetical protein NVS2B6_02920 [Thermoleophilaceae bacterium]